VANEALSSGLFLLSLTSDLVSTGILVLTSAAGSAGKYQEDLLNTVVNIDISHDNCNESLISLR
jgi:hypothetical protein